MCEPNVDLDCWLGILLSGLLRYSVASVERLPLELPEICKKEQLLQNQTMPLAASTSASSSTTLPKDITAWLKENNCNSLEASLRERDALDFATLQLLWKRKPSIGDMQALFPVKSVKETLLFMEALDRLFG